MEPWVPLPQTVIWAEKDWDINGPGWVPTTPAGSIGSTCWPRYTSGFGIASRMPLASITREPAYASSAGWNTATKVPLQQPRLAAYAYSAPSTPMMWKSCPQAWATCSSRPLTASTCVAEEA